jgi:HEAT repeat protein
LGTHVFINILPPEYRDTLTDILLRLLDDPSDAIRRRAAESLGYTGASKAVVRLVQRLGDVSPEVRQEVKRTLSYYGTPAIPYLVRLASATYDEELRYLRKPNPVTEYLASIRAEVIDVLGRIQSPEAEAILLDAVRDHDERVRANALRGLACTGNQKYLEHFLTALQAGADAEAEIAARAVQQLRANSAVKALIKRLERDNGSTEAADSGLKSTIVIALREIGTPTALTAVKKWETGT